MQANHGQDPRQGVPPQTHLWTKNFVLITVINLFLFLGFQFYPAALPPYVKSLGASDSILGWLTATATIATLITRPLAGILLDKLGRRGVFICGLAAMTLISGTMYFFPVFCIILVLRFVHGLAWGVASTAGPTIAADYIPKLRFGEGMGYFSLAASLALAVSPTIALALPPGPMFITATALMALALVMAFFLNYKKVEPQPQKSRFAPYEKSAFIPATIMFMVTTAYGSAVTFMALYAKQHGIENIGPFFIVYATALMLTRPNIGKIVDKHGYGSIVLFGLILLTLALALLSQATNIYVFLASALVYGVGQGAVHTSTQSMAILNAPQHRIGAANATFFTGFDVGIGFGAVTGGIISQHIGYSGMFLCLALCPLAAIPLYMLCVKRPAAN